LILVTGATGYVGGRLVERLLQYGYPVRVIVRDPDRLIGRSWLKNVEVTTGDVLDQSSLSQALSGIESAYYLVHSMLGEKNFSNVDRIGAENFGYVAKENSVKRIIYLGGLGDPKKSLSAHLKSRHETGLILSRSGVPVTEFRAAIIVGSGSISFEMIRDLTERLPVMVTPRWVTTRVQPISISNVLDYLTAVLKKNESLGQVIEIGGEDIVSYKDMMLGYAKARRLKRFIITVPVLTPRLSSYWIHFVTPVSKTIAKPLIDGLKNEVVVTNDVAQKIFPEIRPMNYTTALTKTLKKLESGHTPTSWRDALSSSLQDGEKRVALASLEGIIIEKRATLINASVQSVFNNFIALGGNRGWLYGNWLWQIRGVIDRIIGGVGLRRGRRNPTDLRIGDALDFWRVEDIKLNKSLRLFAEMKLPGKAWLQFETIKLNNHQTTLYQTAFFAPRGLIGLAYWYLLYPIHKLIFKGLSEKLKSSSELKCQ
tara:strand:+ start:3793 stop:5241 length:1449 start_codon:yes stop_codon:yes gene_type:complete